MLIQEIYFEATGSPSIVIISYSDVQGGQTGVVLNKNGAANWLDSDIDDNPLFVDDYHLQADSPCIDTGTEEGAPSEDIEGNTRPLGNGVDIGAYEKSEFPRWDVNNDGVVNIFDLVMVGSSFGETGEKLVADVNNDGKVDIFDLVMVAKHFGEKAAPSIHNISLLQQIYDMLKTVPNPNDNLKLALKELRKLLVPDETKLMQNFPNPFNPETWIPFKLSDDANVVISIYDVEGHLTRKIGLGRMPAGIYTSKDRAVYWDGCNDVGERVSSGVYYYTLRAGDYRATKRMIVVK